MKRKSIITLILAAAFSAALFTSPVEAGRKDYKPRKKQVQLHRAHLAAPLAFHAPARMQHHLVAEYRPFFAGDIYFGPHRHYHAIYLFPVQTGHGVVYREFEYCGGDLFFRNQISYSGANVSFNIGF
jgi:hypothetical protein